MVKIIHQSQIRKVDLASVLCTLNVWERNTTQHTQRQSFLGAASSGIQTQDILSVGKQSATELLCQSSWLNLVYTSRPKPSPKNHHKVGMPFLFPQKKL